MANSWAGCNLVFLQEIVTQHGGKCNIKWKRLFPDFQWVSDDGNETGILVNKSIQIKKIGNDIPNRINGNQWCTWIVVFAHGKRILCGSYSGHIPVYTTGIISNHIVFTQLLTKTEDYAGSVE